MFYGTILVCALEVASCNPDTATRAIPLPVAFPNPTICFIALAQFAATDQVPEGKLILACGSGHVRLNSQPT